MPSALSSFPSALAARADLSGATQFRITAYVGVAGSASAKIRICDGSALDIADVVGAGDAAINVAGFCSGPWTTLRVAMRSATAGLLVRGVGGDATADPSFGVIRMEFK